jgi:hypothetical protein
LAVLLGGNTPIYPRVAEFLNKYFGIPKTLPRRCVVQRFDAQTGAERAVFDQGGEGRLLGFSPDGQTLWTSAFVAETADGQQGVAVIRGWVTPSPWPPAWLIAVTAGAGLLASADYRYSRRRMVVGRAFGGELT